MVRAVKRNIRFIAAAASCRRPVVGTLLRQADVIPVERPQDLTYKGKGQICLTFENVFEALQAEFTEKLVGASIIIEKKELRIKNVIDKTHLIAEGQTEELNIGIPYNYSITPKVEYHDLYQNVWNSLRQGECVGIFPEGGSHDQNYLLPFKAGICIMALGAAAQYNVPVKIVPCGFNYYNPQKFRSKVIIEFGAPYEIPVKLVELYRTNRREAIATLLETCRIMLEGVTTQFRTFHELSSLMACRQLYQMHSQRKLTPKETIELNRRFAKGLEVISSSENAKTELKDLDNIAEFVKKWGLPLTKEPLVGSWWVDLLSLVKNCLKMLTRLAIFIPGTIIMGPATKLIAYLAEKERIRCLKASKVKKHGHDVVGSYKILLSLGILPINFLFHSIVLYYFLKKCFLVSHRRAFKITIIIALLLPIYSLLLVKSYDSLNRTFKKVKDYGARVFRPSLYSEFNRLKDLYSKRIHELVNKYGSEVVENFEENKIIKTPLKNSTFTLAEDSSDENFQ